MKKMWIGGEWTASASGRELPVENPATEEVLETVPRADGRDADAAVAAARAGFAVWRTLSGLARCEKLHHVAADLRRRAQPIAELLTREGGKPLRENLDEIEWVAACFDYYAEVGRNERGRVIAPVAQHQFNMVVKEPYGVVVTIVPWNYPLLLMSWKVAPSLAAGNAVIIKPSEHTPLSTLALVESFQALPAGTVNIVTGLGAEVGEPLVAHKGTDVIAFTGSVATGRKIYTLAAERIKKINLELGGNDPFIVCDDVDLETAVRGAVWAAFLNNGQVCTSAERFYVFESIADRFISRFVELTRQLKLGDPLEGETDLGPMISALQREKVEAKLAQAAARGGRLLTGGQRPSGLKRGYYLEPAVMGDVDHGFSLMREETFGPVAPIMAVRGIEQAIELANDSEYGLGANLYTNNLEYAMTAMENIKAGTFWINDPLTDNDAGPFGGMRLSGMGRELGTEGLAEFMDTKHVHMDYKIERKPYWFPYGRQ